MSWVYIISDGIDVKIGKAKDPYQRLASLQCGNKNQLSIIRLIETSTDEEAYKLEAGLHNMYFSYLIQNEWFNGAMLQDIKRYTNKQLINMFLLQEENNNKLITKKSIKAKEIIKRYSKDFDGTLKDKEVRELAKISRNTFYKYKKELKQGAQ